VPEDQEKSDTHEIGAQPVPTGRVSRLARFGGLASGIASNMALHGARQLVQGQRPDWSGLLLSPANAHKLAGQLAQMRGAAMKVGQIMSMDSGAILPLEFTEVLARLRSEAHAMPPAQLKKVLTANWGPHWLKQFKKFDVRPIAAASIGHVHRAQTKDGRDLAIKIQYPGVRQSIDSDVDNIALLIKLSGLLPKELDIAPLLDQAKQQLYEEAEYQREGRFLNRFGALLADQSAFQVPTLYTQFSTADILTMAYLPGQPIEALDTAPQADRNRVISLLIGLLLQELFDFQLMQTDPNFANYQYNEASGQINLLDFGASRDPCPQLVEKFRRLLRSGLRDDRKASQKAMIDIGYFDAATAPHHQAAVEDLFHQIMAPFQADEIFDFADQAFTNRLRSEAMALGKEGNFWHIPPVETLYLHRKFGGIYLLANRLKAKLNIHQLLIPYAL
jgi:predicted unusual protein kinase regulating ubiquinone biosynthesis (AarF/ABC1/UbiB family)